MKTLETNYQKEVQLNQTLKLDMVEYAESLNKKDEEYDIPRGARRALQLKRGTEFYERAVSLITVDLVEKELASMKFAKQAEGTKNVEDAISIIENVRLQLPDNSIHELTRVAGRGSLPFALSSTSSSLAVADVVDTRKYNSQTQAAIAELLR
jgi:pyridoxal biosynthesis lyase PdxS